MARRGVGGGGVGGVGVGGGVSELGVRCVSIEPNTKGGGGVSELGVDVDEEGYEQLMLMQMAMMV